jgi:uncharacterized protein YjbI with pentapeptide repeats
MHVANLTGADLTAADLSDANLSHANLNEANLNEAKLKGANLYLAILSNNVRGLDPSQIRSAENWDTAFHDKEILERLGLASDHNEKLRKDLEERQL